MLKKSVFILSLLFATQLALAADSYEATTNVLTIPQVKVGDTLYSDVQITVGTIVSVGSNVTADTFDTYNAANNQLSIPVVTVGSATYYNVVITAGTILKVGDSCNIGSTCTKVSAPVIKGILPGDSRISVMFNFMGGKITAQLSNTKFVPATSYTAVCTSNDGGTAGSSRTGSEFSTNLANYSNPLVVSGLTNGKTYTCTVTATAASAVAATSTSSTSTIPNAGSVDATGVLSSIVNTAHTAAYPSYSAYCNYTNQKKVFILWVVLMMPKKSFEMLE